MKTLLLLTPFALLGLAAPAPAADQVRCSVDNGPAFACTYADSALPDGSHRMDFTGNGKHVQFVGKAQTGWWSGRLNGKPAMGYERNRGNMVFSTGDLASTFAWWYPTQEHGSY
jgi:hypothetical protein